MSRMKKKRAPQEPLESSPQTMEHNVLSLSAGRSEVLAVTRISTILMALRIHAGLPRASR